MKEELIRIENGKIRKGDHLLDIDVEISRGESIGIISDNLMNSDTFLDFFRGNLRLEQGKAYFLGERTSMEEIGKKITESTMILERKNKFSPELAAWDFLVALRGGTGRNGKKEQLKRFHSPEAEEVRKNLEIDFQWKDSLAYLTPLSLCRLYLFKAWFYHYEIMVLGHITEVLRENDIHKLMEYVEYFLQRGMAFLLVDQESAFLFSHTCRIDVLKNGITCYRLFPEQFDQETLIHIMRGKDHGKESNMDKINDKKEKNASISSPVLEFDKVVSDMTDELNFQIRKGEIGVLLDYNYQTALEIRRIFLNEKRWKRGQIRVNGSTCSPAVLSSMLGKEIGIQLENPAKKGKTLYYNLSGLENLSSMLIPKMGSRIVRKKIEQNIMKEAGEWFDEKLLRQKISEWTPEDRLRLSYYKWYLVNPYVLICFFPFSGTDFLKYRIIMDMLTMCAEKGMAILMISTDIEGICEKINDANFINRIRYINN
ncbi:hypothetical protein MR857_07285 [bacterium]|nr:hypothetical protein [bacterium]MDY3023554.1 hypothetical protein [Oliverpabstia sp.]